MLKRNRWEAVVCWVVSTQCRSGFLLRVGKDQGAVFALGLYHLKERLWQNASHQPVLKHGPRSLTCVRVLGSDSPARNESKGLLRQTEVGIVKLHYRPTMILREKGLSVSIHVGTRKMVNYARVERSQGKLWWRFVAVLTCKLIVELGYRGERLIEPSSSWFLPKFPSG